MQVDFVFKIGGQLCGTPRVIEDILQTLLTFRKLGRFFVLPGGGVFADKTRDLYAKGALTEHGAHWMAIKALEMTGLMLRNAFADLNIFSRPAEFDAAWARGGVPAFFPFDYLYQTDELPHSWEVTSDSIAYYLGQQAGARYVFLVKDTDGIHHQEPHADFRQNPVYPELTPAELQAIQERWEVDETIPKYYCVDPYLPRLMEGADLPCVVINHANLLQVPVLLEGHPTPRLTVVRPK